MTHEHPVEEALRSGSNVFHPVEPTRKSKGPEARMWSHRHERQEVCSFCIITVGKDIQTAIAGASRSGRVSEPSGKRSKGPLPRM